jgi:hypothetical protein
MPQFLSSLSLMLKGSPTLAFAGVSLAAGAGLLAGVLLAAAAPLAILLSTACTVAAMQANIKPQAHKIVFGMFMLASPL